MPNPGGSDNISTRGCAILSGLHFFDCHFLGLEFSVRTSLFGLFSPDVLTSKGHL